MVVREQRLAGGIQLSSTASSLLPPPATRSTGRSYLGSPDTLDRRPSTCTIDFRLPAAEIYQKRRPPAMYTVDLGKRPSADVLGPRAHWRGFGRTGSDPIDRSGTVAKRMVR